MKKPEVQAIKKPLERGFLKQHSNNQNQVIWIVVCMMVAWVEMVFAFA